MSAASKPSKKTARPPKEEKRERGRPMVGGTGGAFRRTNLSLDEGSLAIAERIHENTSAAVRLALAYWDEKHPQK